MTGRPAEIYRPFLYMGYKKLFYHSHEFFLAKVDWDWRMPYELTSDWERYDSQYGLVEDDYQHRRICPEFLSCDRWLKAHCPELRDWLVEGNHRYLLRSTGHQTKEPSPFGGYTHHGFTVAALDIFDEDVAMEIRLRW